MRRPVKFPNIWVWYHLANERGEPIEGTLEKALIIHGWKKSVTVRAQRGQLRKQNNLQGWVWKHGQFSQSYSLLFPWGIKQAEMITWNPFSGFCSASRRALNGALNLTLERRQRRPMQLGRWSGKSNTLTQLQTTRGCWSSSQKPKLLYSLRRRVSANHSGWKMVSSIGRADKTEVWDIISF